MDPNDTVLAEMAFHEFSLSIEIRSAPVKIVFKVGSSNHSLLGSIHQDEGNIDFGIGTRHEEMKKAAVIALTEVLAEEYQEGPSFNVLALGAVQTKMLMVNLPWHFLIYL